MCEVVDKIMKQRILEKRREIPEFWRTVYVLYRSSYVFNG